MSLFEFINHQAHLHGADLPDPDPRIAELEAEVEDLRNTILDLREQASADVRAINQLREQIETMKGQTK